jgi:DNA-binding CsgD family transcriptional regulator
VFALTEREREVPVLLADGMSTQEAAARLGIG